MLKRISVRVAMVLSFAAVALVGVTPAAATHEPTLVTATDNSTYAVGSPVTDDEWIVWTGGSVSVHSHCADVYAARVDDREPMTIARIGDGGDVDVDGDTALVGSRVADCDEMNTTFSEGGLWLIHLPTGESSPVVENVDVGSVAIDGTQVAWIETEFLGPNSRYVIRTHDYQTDSLPIEVATYELDGFVGELRLDGRQLSWTVTSTQAEEYTLYRAQIGQEPEVVEEFGDRFVQIALFEDTLAVIEDGIVSVTDLTTGETRELDQEANYAVATDGRYVFWSGATQTHVTITGYDLETGARFIAYEAAMTNEVTVGWVNDIWIEDGVLGWDRYGFETYRTAIHVAYLSDRLPSGRVADPGDDDPKVTYYPESGHTLGWGFRDYWNANGGLPVFGYPLTEEFLERNADLGGEFTVQYFERERFEYHPENEGTPYEVLLGRLGAELLVMQGRNWEEFPKSDPNEPHYVPETGHAVALEFWEYWRTHGLELGDAGNSYAESVALFGYPLSEPMMETNADGDTVLTQYFERAVFEFHPNNDDPYKVLLRRLGAEMLAARGWELQP